MSQFRERAVPQSITKHFGSLEDPRVVGRSSHNLLEIVTIALMAVIGALKPAQVRSEEKSKRNAGII